MPKFTRNEMRLKHLQHAWNDMRRADKSLHMIHDDNITRDIVLYMRVAIQHIEHEMKGLHAVTHTKQEQCLEREICNICIDVFLEKHKKEQEEEREQYIQQQRERGFTNLVRIVGIE